MLNEEKKAIEIVKEFNKENKFRDCGRLNNAIDIVIRMAEERDRYNITTLPFEELKEMIEQNKNISIFGKEYISKDKIRELLETERMKALARFDNKLTVMQRIYKRNLQVSLIDKLKKELLDKN